MRPRARRFLACLLGLVFCVAALSTFEISVKQLNYALPPRLANRAPSTKVTLCTQVHNDMPYLIEYIEFMKIMGIARFIICDERSDDDIHLLQELYESRGRTYVTVIPSPQPGTGMDGQMACYVTCFELAKTYTDWFIVIDDDEFAVPTIFDTIPEYLDSLADDIGMVTAWETRFGTGGATDRFCNSLTRGPDGRLVYGNPRGSLQLITQEHLRRQPKEEFGWQLPENTSWEAMFPNCSRHACNDYPTCSGTQAFCNESLPDVDKWPVCVNGLSKSVARTEAVAELSLHVHNLDEGWQSIDSDAHGLVSWHHYLRTAEDAWLKHDSWVKCDPIDILRDVDASYFSHVEDRRFTKYESALKLRLADFTA